MSGGVDSSVAAALLKKQGYDCIGIYMNFWSDPTTFDKNESKGFPENKCCSIETMNTARRIANKLGIPFYVFNVRERFKKQVVDYFIDSYKICETPNPCVECNRNIKFGFLFERMKQLGADYIATGHYVNIKQKKAGGKVVYEMYMGKDKLKDQSYFLYTLTQDKLKHVLFPVGNYKKKDVRKMAEKFGIPEVSKTRESQGICFFPDKNYSDFLKRYFSENVIKEGPIVTVEGEKIGTHKGLQFFTVGQRKGIEIGGEKDPLYVVRLDYSKNTLIVGWNNQTYQEKFEVNKLNFINEKLKNGKYKVYARIRYRFPPEKALLVKKGEKAEITFNKPQRAITPGQSVVFYERKKVIGGGIITKVNY